ncbi:MAG: hypothetical protein ACFFG0_45770 [Candidatus Thorarchaeota archaeon]
MLIISIQILERDTLRLEIEEFGNYYNEIIKIKDGNKLIPILSNFHNQSTLKFWEGTVQFSKPVQFRKRTKKKLYYLLEDDDFSLNLDYCLEEDNILHIRYKLFNKKEIKLSKLLATYFVLLDDKPDFTWVPHIRPKEHYVIGDHVFRSPVVIYKNGNYSFALIPDLKTLGQNHPFRTFLDLNLKPQNKNDKPSISYGFGNYRPIKHYLFKHLVNKKWIISENTDLTFRYYIIVFREKSVLEILQFINKFLWEKYGRRFFYSSIKPQVLPYQINVDEGFKALFERHKFWGDFKINNVLCGGFWLRTWIGANKMPIKFFSPNQIKDFFNLHTNLQRIAVLWNNAWFLNIRSTYGLRFFGDYWKNEDFIKKSDQMVNTIIELPRINGIFPSLVLPASYNATEYSVINGSKAFFYMDEFNLVDADLAMYWALKFYQDFNPKNNRIIQKSKELLELIIILQLENGAIPTFIDFDQNKKTPIIKKDLINSASSGASLMFLLEYYKIIKDERILPVCEKIAEYIKTNIIPHDKWHDFEPFYSCTYPLYSTYDCFTQSNVMNTLCIYWCAEGFKEFYKITGDIEYLNSGERVLAVLSLFQQIWDMPYISYNTFGGFGVQNADAELNDARQGLFVKTYMEYYIETGKWEYMERGIAALRASWALQLLEEYKELCPGNLEGIPTIDGVDRGCLFENYGHNGRDQRIAGYIMFDWGLGTAAMATAYAKKHFGDLFIDFKEQIVFGIDGILMKKFGFIENQVQIECEIIDGKEDIIIMAREVPYALIEIMINGKSIGNLKKEDLQNGLIKNVK